MIPQPFRRLFRNPFARGVLAREVEDEHAFHLEEKTRALIADGVSAQEAGRRAESAFGPRRHWRREALRERRRGRARRRRLEVGIAWVDDLVIAFRQLLRRPASTLATVLVLALGVGFGVSVLTTVDAVLFRPLPYRNARRVVWVNGVLKQWGWQEVSPANWLDWKRMQHSFAQMAATRDGATSLLKGSGTYVPELRVESAFFRVLGSQPLVGRLLDEGDDRPGAPPVAVLAYSLWVRQFGADPEVVGREVTIGGHRTTVVGVLPRSFEYLDLSRGSGPRRELFVNDLYEGDRTSRWSGGTFLPVALLRKGVTLKQAQADMDGVASALARAYPGIDGSGTRNGPLRIRLTPLRRRVTEQVRGGTLLLGAFALLLLLVVCVNVAGLLLARIVDRSRELALRASLGAGRLRLARETLVQVALFTLFGGAAGLGLATLLLQVIRSIAPPDTPFLDRAHLDGRVALGTAVLAAAMWALAGLVPALRAGRVDLNRALKSGEGGGSSARSATGRAIILVQVALATALVTGAGIMVQTYAYMSAVDPGAHANHVRVLRYRLPLDRYTSSAGTLGDYPVKFQNAAWAAQVRKEHVYRIGAATSDFVNRAMARLRGVPGVRGVAAVNYPPFWGRGGFAVVAVNTSEQGKTTPNKEWYRLKWVSPGYFRVLGIPVLRGRPLGAQNGAGARRTMVVNQAFVDTYLPDARDPVGAVVRVRESASFPPRSFTVVGVVANVVHANPSEPVGAAVYIPTAQRAELWASEQVGFPLDVTFMVRVDPDARVSSGALRAAVAKVDPTLVPRGDTTLKALHDALFGQARFWLVLLGSFAGVALLLAAAGTFALLAQSVRHRTREIGIRRALGATTWDVLGRVMRDALGLTAVGLLLGLSASWYLSRILSTEVVGARTLSIAPAVAVVCVLLASAAAAAWIPARWAQRVHPVDALRTD